MPYVNTKDPAEVQCGRRAPMPYANTKDLGEVQCGRRAPMPYVIPKTQLKYNVGEGSYAICKHQRPS